MKYFIGTDHAGVKLARFVEEFLKNRDYIVKSYLPLEAKVDYPDYAKKICHKVLESYDSRGILICGTGIGMSIVANRFCGIRAAVCTNSYMAKMTRLHNDCNVLCLGERLLGEGVVESILEAFVETDFEGGRHLVRIQKIDEGC